jgi:fructosamine-3-kinase
MPWQIIAEQIRVVTGEPFEVLQRSSIGGGCINETWHLQGDARAFFVKFNHANKQAMFAAEASGLRTLADAHALRVPQPITYGVTGNRAYLVLEFIAMTGRGDHRAQVRLGEQLAKLHAFTAQRFGWERENHIGATPQSNTWCDDWVEFWSEQRLGYQLQLAGQNGISTRVLRKGDALRDALPALFDTYTPVASLLHGDLWGGNWGVSAAGEPIIFDPAVYFGDRETDLAMTELFGGFGTEFYAAYQASWPLHAGFKTRKQLYNLYHVLNHYNLFGGGYASQAESMLDRLLAELR